MLIHGTFNYFQKAQITGFTCRDICFTWKDKFNLLDSKIWVTLRKFSLQSIHNTFGGNSKTSITIIKPHGEVFSHRQIFFSHQSLLHPISAWGPTCSLLNYVLNWNQLNQLPYLAWFFQLYHVSTLYLPHVTASSFCRGLGFQWPQSEQKLPVRRSFLQLYLIISQSTK